MTTQYNIWIEIEEHDEDTGIGENVDTPGASVATFDNYDDAYTFASLLTDGGNAVCVGRIEERD